MTYNRGDVIWGPEPFKPAVKPRPWVIISNENHPFHGEEYLAVTLTTTKRPEALEIIESHWIEGSAPRKSYAAPWVVITIKHKDIKEKIGKLDLDFLDKIIKNLESYICQS